jgi:hypothetical protein
MANQGGWSEWEPIKILLEGDRGLQQDEHNFQHMSPTYYPSWPRPRNPGVLLVLGTNNQLHEPENAAEHQLGPH